MIEKQKAKMSELIKDEVQNQKPVAADLSASSSADVQVIVGK